MPPNQNSLKPSHENMPMELQQFHQNTRPKGNSKTVDFTIKPVILLCFPNNQNHYYFNYRLVAVSPAFLSTDGYVRFNFDAFTDIKQQHPTRYEWADDDRKPPTCSHLTPSKACRHNTAPKLGRKRHDFERIGQGSPKLDRCWNAI